MTGSSRIRVLIAEDDAAVSHVLAALIRIEPGLELVDAVVNADAAIALAGAELPDVAIVDVRMPGGGAWATREIRHVSPGTSVIAFSGTDDPASVNEMLAAGAAAYLVKGSSTDTVIAAIEQAHDPKPGDRGLGTR
jgi:DNA-binding NarL/FixJ family response regulator